MPRTMRKKSSPIKNVEERPKLRARRRKGPTNSETTMSVETSEEKEATNQREEPVLSPEILVEDAPRRRSARRSIVQALEDEAPAKRITRRASQLEPVKTPKKRPNRRTTSNVSGVYEIDLNVKITDDSENLLIDSPKTPLTTPKSPKNRTYSKSPKNLTFSPKSPKNVKRFSKSPKNLTFSPKSPKNVICSPKSSKNLTFSPKSPKNLTFSPETPVFTPQIRRITSTPFVATPRSIIKSKENDTSHITVRKRRSDPEPMDISLCKKSRVTFHPNTSIFKLETQDQDVDLLNDLYEYPEGVEPPKTPQQSATPGKELNVTFTPEENPQPVKSLQKSHLTPALSKLVLSTSSKVVTNQKSSTAKKEFRARQTPNFKSIHKKNAEKMESLVDNYERKQERAKRLFNWKAPTPSSNQTLPEITAVKKVPVPHLGRKSMTRFGFNKRAVQDRKLAMKENVNKSKVIVAKRQENREYVKGVRSNRRFDLLMQSRENNI